MPESRTALSATSVLSRVLNALADEVVVLDRRGVVIATNAAWDQFCEDNGGDTAHCYRGTNYLDVCRNAVDASSAEAALIPDGLARTLRTGETFHCEYPCDSPTEKRWFELTANRLVLDEETHLILQHRNITARHVEREAVERAHVTASAMAALIASTSDAVLSYDLDGNIVTWNRAAEKFYGYTEAEVLGRSLEILYPPDWPKPLTAYRDEILAGRLTEFEATRVARDGTRHEVWVSCAPIRGPKGEVVAISNIHRDVTEVRKAEHARDLIAHEVVHRAKNMLTVVTAMLRQTARVETTREGFMRSFEARIRSLSASTDMLVQSAWSSINLVDLIERHLEPFVAKGDPRIAVSGPPVTLQPQCVQTIGMAIHELATNSMKYGALTRDDGRIEMAWSVAPADGGPTLQFDWHETASPSGPPTRRNGFGNTVLTSLAPSMLDAETSYNIDPDAVSWTIRISATHFDSGR